MKNKNVLPRPSVNSAEFMVIQTEKMKTLAYDEL